jgi:hypothetical protein
MVRTDQENEDYIAMRHGELREVRRRRRGYHAGAYQRGKERADDISLSPLKSFGRASLDQEDSA